MNETKKKTYTLTMSEEHAQIVVKALDLYSRIGIGQFENILEVYDQGFAVSGSLRDEARTLINMVKQIFGHPANGSHGIHNPKVNNGFRVAFDIQQVLRHRLAFDRSPKGGIQVDFDTPQTAAFLPLPTVTSE